MQSQLREISFGNRKTRTGQPWSIAYGSFIPFTIIRKYPTEGIKSFPR